MLAFFDLYGRRAILVVKSIPKLLLYMMGISSLLAFLTWFVLDVVFGLTIAFLSLWKWIFIATVGVSLFWDFLVVGIIFSVLSFMLMKKFETTPEIIFKAVFKFHLLEKKNKKIREGDKESFEEWYSRSEDFNNFAEKMANVFMGR